VAPKRKDFRGKNFADPTALKSKKFDYQLKNKYPPMAKNFTKVCHSVVTHVIYHFLWRQHLSPNKLEYDQDIVTPIDSHILLTYDC
jgi:hypothetical protein